MCIIAYKPSGVAMLTPNTIEACWDNNSDGAGFMIKSGGKVRWWKGFMTLEALNTALNEQLEKVNVEKSEIAIHFRIATHGGVSPGMCHPFPLTDHIEDMTKLYGENACVMHNGVILKAPNIKGYSDTASYITAFLFNHVVFCGVNSPWIEETINGSRLLIASSNHKTVRIGSWVKAASGWLFSNSGYVHITTYFNRGKLNNKYSNLGYYGYQWDDDEVYSDWQNNWGSFCKNSWSTYDHKTHKFHEEPFLEDDCMQICKCCVNPNCKNCFNLKEIYAKTEDHSRLIWIEDMYPYLLDEAVQTIVLADDDDDDYRYMFEAGNGYYRSESQEIFIEFDGNFYKLTGTTYAVPEVDFNSAPVTKVSTKFIKG